MLFAWHHHPLPLSSGALVVAAAGGHETPASADDDCQICFSLGHHHAAPADSTAAPSPACMLSPPTAVPAVLTPAADYLLFRSRAPPRV
jgi:hypothetical protein